MQTLCLVLTLGIASASIAQPDTLFDYNIDSGLRFGDFTWSSLNTHPNWIRVRHSGSEYLTIGLLGISDPRFVPSSSAAIYDGSGSLMASITALNTENLGMNFGSSWNTGSAGSPTMLLPNQWYYVGFAPGGTVFHENFSADFVGATGIQRFLLAPTPGSSSVLLLPGIFAMRRRRIAPSD